ncbi:hypothetical protein AABE10_36205, partial [Paraburkholderia diazotrophica]
GDRCGTPLYCATRQPTKQHSFMKGKIVDGEARDRLIIWIRRRWKNSASQCKRSLTQSSTTSITRRSTGMRMVTNGMGWAIRRIGFARRITRASNPAFFASRVGLRRPKRTAKVASPILGKWICLSRFRSVLFRAKCDKNLASMHAPRDRGLRPNTKQCIRALIHILKIRG